MQHFEIQLIRPPVSVLCASGFSSAKDTSAEGTAAEWAFAFAHNRLRCSYGCDSWTGSKILPLADVLGDFPLCRSLFTGVVFAALGLACFSETFRTVSPVDDLCFVDFVAHAFAGTQAGSKTDRTVNIDQVVAGSAN